MAAQQKTIRKGGEKGTPAISTASLPDIVFMLLFFFMVSTSMREQEMKVEIKTPSASEVQRLEKKSLASYIYIGPPVRNLRSQFGDSPRIQLNDSFSTKEHITQFIAAERDKLSEKDRPDMTVSLKIDKNVRMGLVTDVKQELRRANALSISYSASQGAPSVPGE